MGNNFSKIVVKSVFITSAVSRRVTILDFHETFKPHVDISQVGSYQECNVVFSIKYIHYDS